MLSAILDKFTGKPADAETIEKAVGDHVDSLDSNEKKELAREVGTGRELHLPGHKFVGPGTHLRERITRGDIPISALDLAALKHDLQYTNASEEYRGLADVELLSSATAILNENPIDPYALAVVGAMSAKIALARTGVGLPGLSGDDKPKGVTSEQWKTYNDFNLERANDTYDTYVKYLDTIGVSYNNAGTLLMSPLSPRSGVKKRAITIDSRELISRTLKGLDSMDRATPKALVATSNIQSNMAGRPPKMTAEEKREHKRAWNKEWKAKLNASATRLLSGSTVSEFADRVNQYITELKIATKDRKRDDKQSLAVRVDELIVPFEKGEGTPEGLANLVELAGRLGGFTHNMSQGQLVSLVATGKRMVNSQTGYIDSVNGESLSERYAYEIKPYLPKAEGEESSDEPEEPGSSDEKPDPAEPLPGGGVPTPASLPPAPVDSDEFYTKLAEMFNGGVQAKEVRALAYFLQTYFPASSNIKRLAGTFLDKEKNSLNDEDINEARDNLLESIFVDSADSRQLLASISDDDQKRMRADMLAFMQGEPPPEEPEEKKEEPEGKVAPAPQTGPVNPYKIPKAPNVPQAPYPAGGGGAILEEDEKAPRRPENYPPIRAFHGGVAGSEFVSRPVIPPTAGAALKKAKEERAKAERAGVVAPPVVFRESKEGERVIDPAATAEAKRGAEDALARRVRQFDIENEQQLDADEFAKLWPSYKMMEPEKVKKALGALAGENVKEYTRDFSYVPVRQWVQEDNSIYQDGLMMDKLRKSVGYVSGLEAGVIKRVGMDDITVLEQPPLPAPAPLGLYKHIRHGYRKSSDRVRVGEKRNLPDEKPWYYPEYSAETEIPMVKIAREGAPPIPTDPELHPGLVQLYPSRDLLRANYIQNPNIAPTDPRDTAYVSLHNQEVVPPNEDGGLDSTQPMIFDGGRTGYGTTGL